MEKFKKGILVVKDKIKEISFDVSICDGEICDDSKEFFDYFMTLPNESMIVLEDYFNNRPTDEDEVNRLLQEFCKNKAVVLKGYPVIYREITDIYGNKYGKEIWRNRVFPIPSEITNSFSFKEKEVVSNNVYHGTSKINSSSIFRINGRDRQFYITLKDANNEEYFTNDRNIVSEYSLFRTYADSFEAEKTIGKIKKTSITRYKVVMKLDFVHKNANRLEVALMDKGYANEKEVNDYEKRENSFIGSINSKIVSYSELNNLGEIEKASSIKGKDTSDLLTLINNLEVLLTTIKVVNTNLYNELYEEYQKLINEESNAQKDAYEKLTKFYEDLKSKLILSSNGDSAIEHLDGIISKCLDDINNGRFLSINLSYITELHGDFLRNENNYGIRYIQKINSRFNYLYFLYLYCNKDNHDLREINDSYIPNSVKGILNVCFALYERKAIKYNHEKIDSSDFNIDHGTVFDLIDIINNIEIVNISTAKQLIKS